MWKVETSYTSAEEYFHSLRQELFALIDGETNLIANLANISSWIYHSYPQLNWCGFYLWNEADQELVLGPFQGRPACIRIKPGKGVCGTSYSRQATVRVDDVHQFPGHIACDAASQSELVVPLLHRGQVLAVLDLDSPQKNTFTQADEDGFTNLMRELAVKLFA
jgi:L-methionine (R)-S-oxide reductase